MRVFKLTILLGVLLLCSINIGCNAEPKEVSNINLIQAEDSVVLLTESEAIDNVFGEGFCGNNVNLDEITIMPDAIPITPFKYIDMITEQEKIIWIAIKDPALEEIINLWMYELSEIDVSYGSTKSSENILKTLIVNSAEFSEDKVVIDFNEVFLEFDNNNTDLGLLLWGIHNILEQETEVKTFDITINGDDSIEFMNPEAYVIKNLHVNRED